MNTPNQAYKAAFDDNTNLQERGATCIRGAELFTYKAADAAEVQGPVYMHWKGMKPRFERGLDMAIFADLAHHAHFDAGLGERDHGELDGVVVNEKDEVIGRFLCVGWYVELTYLGNHYKDVMATGPFVLKTTR